MSSSLPFSHNGFFISRVRVEQDPGEQSSAMMDGEALDTEKRSQASLATSTQEAPGRSPIPSLLVLSIVQCGLLALPALNTSVMRCHPSSALAAPILSSAQAALQLLWSSAPFVHLRPAAKALQALQSLHVLPWQ